MPSYANPQSLNRYSYVNNNPLRYTDPTGHMMSEGDGGGCGKKCKVYVEQQRKKKDDDDGGDPLLNLDLPNSDQLPCGELLTCDEQSPYAYAESLLPFTRSDACHFLAQDPILCNSNAWRHFPNISMTSSHRCSQGFWSCYDPDAIMWGAGFSGSMPGIYGTAGLEEIVMFSNGKRAAFSYGGEGGSAGLGASGTAYGGLVFNLKAPDNYVGPFGSGGFTISVLDAGITASYFWDTSNAPFSAGATQGLAIGYAPGAQASIWWSSTSYSEIWRSGR